MSRPSLASLLQFAGKRETIAVLCVAFVGFCIWKASAHRGLPVSEDTLDALRFADLREPSADAESTPQVLSAKSRVNATRLDAAPVPVRERDRPSPIQRADYQQEEDRFQPAWLSGVIEVDEANEVDIFPGE